MQFGQEQMPDYPVAGGPTIMSKLSQLTVLSPVETTAESVAPLANRGPARFASVLLTRRELEALGQRTDPSAS
jgi:hypothetical protein